MLFTQKIENLGKIVLFPSIGVHFCAVAAHQFHVNFLSSSITGKLFQSFPSNIVILNFFVYFEHICVSCKPKVNRNIQSGAPGL